MTLNEIVVDANVIVSALIKNSAARELLLKDKTPKLFTPDFIEEELFKHSCEFAEKLNVEENDIKIILNEIFETAEIRVMPFQEYKYFMNKAVQLSPDLNDAPYFALALKLNSPIWSQDKALKKQAIINVYSTHDLINMNIFC